MTPPGGAAVDLHDQVIRQNCRTLKTPAIAAQYQGLAEAAAREGHSHVRYLDALLGAEIDERERKAVLRRVKEARRPCPGAWCRSAVGIALSGEPGRICQAGTADSLTIGSSLTGAMVSRLM